MKFYIHETGNGYIYDKRIFWGMIAVILVLVFSVAKDYNYSFKTNFYFKCDKYSCKNPLMSPQFQAYNIYTGYDYKKDCLEDWCKQETLPRGEYGTKPPNSFIFNNFSLIIFVLIALTLILNHFIHNKGKKPGIKLNLPNKWLKRIRKLGDNLDKLEDE